MTLAASLPRGHVGIVALALASLCWTAGALAAQPAADPAGGPDDGMSEAPADTTSAGGPTSPDGVADDAAPDPPPAARSEAPPPLPLGPTLTGQRGLLRLWAATPSKDGDVTASLNLTGFVQGGFLVSGDSNRYVGSALGIFGVPVEGLEVGGGLHLSMNENTAFEPATLVTIGDPYLGVRYGHTVTSWMSLGGGLEVTVPTGSGVLAAALAATSLRALLDADFRPTPELLIGLNVGFHLDRSSHIFDTGLLNQAQRFAAQVQPYNRVLLGLGIAYQVAWAAPFVEYTGEVALGGGLAFGDNPQRVSVGARLWPLDDRTLSLLVAADVGVAGRDPGDPEAARQPAYAVTLGAAWDFGEAPAVEGGVRVREVVRTERVEVPVDKPRDEGVIVGQVVDALDGTPVRDARVFVASEPPITLMSDPSEGRFRSCPVPSGPMKLKVTADDHQPKTQVVLVHKGAQAKITVKLQPAKGKTVGSLRGTVRSLQGKPLAAKVRVPTRRIKQKAGADGTFALTLETGVFDVLISHKGYATQRHKIKLRAGEEVILNVELFPRK